ncbi:hypothetical protein ACIGHN_13365 [Acidovorax sp. NPDC077693]|uniref:hypothetical protein n=1 Tax=unclassified Acidovorax TaxID=2684926 RepID=UPI0037C5CEDC
MSKTTQPTPDTAAFSAFMLDTTSRLELELPNGAPMLYEGKPVAVQIYGPATDEYAKARAAMEKESAARVFRAMGANKNKKKNGEDDAEADAKFLTAITAGFENFPYPGGAEAIYREPRLNYIGNQVRTHVNDLGNFFKESAKS